MPSVRRVPPLTSSPEFTSCLVCPQQPALWPHLCPLTHQASLLAVCHILARRSEKLPDGHSLSSPPHPQKLPLQPSKLGLHHIPSELSIFSLLYRAFSVLPSQNYSREMPSLNPASFPIISQAHAQGVCLCVSGQTFACPRGSSVLLSSAQRTTEAYSRLLKVRDLTLPGPGAGCLLSGAQT